MKQKEKKLFPKKISYFQKRKNEIIVNLQVKIHYLEHEYRKLERNSKEYRLKTLQAFKVGKKDIALLMLIKSHDLNDESQIYFKRINRLETELNRVRDAIDEESLDRAFKPVIIKDDFSVNGDDTELSLDEDEESEVTNKEELEDEINKLKKELEMI